MAGPSLSNRQSENIRFWFEVFNGLSLPCKLRADKVLAEPSVWLPVPGTGFGGYGLPFVAYYHPDEGKIGCYLKPRKGETVANRIFDAFEVEPGMRVWRKQQCIGYEREIGAMPKHGEAETPEFWEAVRWMRYHLDKLVRTLHSHIQTMLGDE